MKKAILTGFFAGICLVLFYFLVMGLASRSFQATISQFWKLWYWILILAAGFGIQIGLYIHLKSQIAKFKSTNVIVSGTSSAISMIACCAHHITDVLPLIGLTGAAIFLTNYQIPIIITGVIINLAGIIYMLKIAKIWSR